MHRFTLFVILLVLFVASLTFTATAEPLERQPNILMIVADDLGYSDLGSFGSEIDTPNLDRIAAEGIRFSNFHTLPTCAPTRSVLLTGTDNHIAGLGSQLNSEKQEGQPGYEGHLNSKVVTAAEILGASGYRTYMSGKWHLGHEPRYRPHARGFQETFALLPGGASHFADATPLHPAEPVVYSRNGATMESLPKDFYSTRNYTDNLLSWMQRDINSQSPFFAYLAFTAPHDPLHAPQAYIDKYRGRYDEGYEVLREKRFHALKKSGLLSQEVEIPAWPSVVRRWNSLSAQEKSVSSRNMEVYAAMIDYMDGQIGRIYELLLQHGQLDNTLILFLSDNGANAFPATRYPTHTAEFHAQFDNDLNNLGKPGSFTSIGAGWATASSAVFSKFKGFLTEGGIRTPAIVKAPTLIAAIPPNNNYIHVSDWLPTFLELADVYHPSKTDAAIAPLQGKSLTSLLSSETPDELLDRSQGFELHGFRAFFKDDWKALQEPPPFGSGDWKLFNLKDDPAELINLARSEKEKLNELIAAHELYEREVGVIYDDFPMTKSVVRTLFAVYCLLMISLIFTLVQHRHNWSIIVVGLDLFKLSCLVGLFTPYYHSAGWVLFLLLLSEGTMALFRTRSLSKAWIPLITCALIPLLQFIKSGYLVSFLL